MNCTVYWCLWGWWLAGDIFPDCAVKQFVDQQSTSSDILVVIESARKCKKIQHFKGKILFFDGEHGVINSNVSNTYAQALYFGPRHYCHDNVSLCVPFFALAFEAGLKNVPVHRAVFSLPQYFLGYANSHCVHFREKAFAEIAQLGVKFNLGKIAVVGRCNGGLSNVSYVQKIHPDGPERRFGNINMWQELNAKFCLVMENANVPGYITEKMFYALGSCVPIYYGSSDIFLIINEKAFIFYDVRKPQSALDTILRVAQNDTLRHEMLLQPLLRNGYISEQLFFSIKSGYQFNLIRTLVLKDKNIHTLSQYVTSTDPRDSLFSQIPLTSCKYGSLKAIAGYDPRFWKTADFAYRAIPRFLCSPLPTNCTVFIVADDLSFAVGLTTHTKNCYIHVFGRSDHSPAHLPKGVHYSSLDSLSYWSKRYKNRKLIALHVEASLFGRLDSFSMHFDQLLVDFSSLKLLENTLSVVAGKKYALVAARRVEMSPAASVATFIAP